MIRLALASQSRPPGLFGTSKPRVRPFVPSVSPCVTLPGRYEAVTDDAVDARGAGAEGGVCWGSRKDSLAPQKSHPVDRLPAIPSQTVPLAVSAAEVRRARPVPHGPVTELGAAIVDPTPSLPQICSQGPLTSSHSRNKANTWSDEPGQPHAAPDRRLPSGGGHFRPNCPAGRH